MVSRADGDGRRARLVEAAALMLKAVGGSMNITPLNKALFYLDLRSLLDTGESATGVTYVALREGPVVAQYPRELVLPLERLGLALQSDGDDGSKPVSLLKEPSAPQHLNALQIRLLRDTAVWAKTKGAVWVSKFSHKNMGWEIAWSTGLGAGTHARAIDMHVAMQQLADDDAWLAAPLSKTERTLIEKADAETGAKW